MSFMFLSKSFEKHETFLYRKIFLFQKQTDKQKITEYESSHTGRSFFALSYRKGTKSKKFWD